MNAAMCCTGRRYKAIITSNAVAKTYKCMVLNIIVIGLQAVTVEAIIS